MEWKGDSILRFDEERENEEEREIKDIGRNWKKRRRMNEKS